MGKYPDFGNKYLRKYFFRVNFIRFCQINLFIYYFHSQLLLTKFQIYHVYLIKISKEVNKINSFFMETKLGLLLI